MENSMRRSALTLILLSIWISAGAAVTEREIDYRSGDLMLKGSIAYDDSLPGRRPGVLVIHEWSGLNEHARHNARRLAEAGYVALALDMYGEARQAQRPH
jgi:dienelactone hydrolase